MDIGNIDRRTFAALVGGGALAAGCLLPGCSTGASSASSDAEGQSAPHATTASAGAASLPSMPPASPSSDSMFDVDENINMETIDEWILRDDCIYRDMRMVKDPAAYEEIGGNSDLAITIEGFTICPFPYIGTLQPLPVSGAYDGERLFDIEWGEDGEIVSATSNYAQSERLVEELFPRDKKILLICGGGGYASMMRKLLIHLGWNADDVYNVGGAWEYTGYRAVELINYADEANPSYYLWRADVAYIDHFEYYTPA